MEFLTVGEIAKRSGLPVSTIHFWESKGLIHSTRSNGNQRRFARPELRRIAVIKIGQRAGIPLIRNPRRPRYVAGGPCRLREELGGAIAIVGSAASTTVSRASPRCAISWGSASAAVVFRSTNAGCAIRTTSLLCKGPARVCSISADELLRPARGRPSGRDCNDGSKRRRTLERLFTGLVPRDSTVVASRQSAARTRGRLAVATRSRAVADRQAAGKGRSSVLSARRSARTRAAAA